MVALVCEICTQGFQRPPSVVAKGKGRYCSTPCRIKAQTREVKRPGKQERQCLECGVLFFMYPASPQRFCVRACWHAWNRRPEIIATRFWSFYDRSGDCWLWTGGLSGEYGGFGFSQAPGKVVHVLAHRMAWVLANGRLIPDGMNVCHTCDVKLCGRPEHLFLGTQQDNIRDMFYKGRNSFHLPNGKTWVPK